MKCSEKIIKNVAGVLLFNCEFPINNFTGFTLTNGKVLKSDVDTAILSGKLLKIDFESSANLSANNESGTSVANTAGNDTVKISEQKLGLNAILNAREGTLQTAFLVEGANLGYFITKDGDLIGDRSDGAKLSPIKMEVQMADDSMPNGAVLTGSQPETTISIGLGGLKKWSDTARITDVAGADHYNDFMELAPAELVQGADLTTLKIVDFLGETLKINGVTNAKLVLSEGSQTLTSITDGVVTLSAAVTAGTVVTIFGTVENYYFTNSVTMKGV